MVTAPIVGRLTDRVGSRGPMTAGLLLVAEALFLTTRIEDGTGYGRLLPALILMRFGLGLSMAPMSTAAINAVSATKAGVAAGILAMARMLGGTFGVAVLGALFQHLASSRLSDTLAATGLTAAQRDQLVHNLGSAHDSAGPGLNSDLAAQVVRAARDAFVHALSSSMWLCAGVTLAGALMAWVLIEREPGGVRRAGRQPRSGKPAPSTLEPTLAPPPR
jgi:hypothetical protein